MAKYRQSDKLTQEQRKDIAMLVNCGARRLRLAEGYGMSIATIEQIAMQMGKYLGEENIARTFETQFQYAQFAYSQLGEKERKYIELGIFRSIIEIAVQPICTPEAKLLSSIFGGRPEVSPEGVVLKRKYATRAFYQNISEGKKYSSIDEAVAETKRTANGLEEAELSPEQMPGGNRYEDDIRTKLEKILEGLTYREREIIKLRYGIGDGYTYTLEEVARRFMVTRERVRQIEARAIRRLEHPVRARRLEGFLERRDEDK